MDPYLEGPLWPDFHNALAAKIRQQLMPALRPRYTARLGVYVVEDPDPEADVGIFYPDVGVLRAHDALFAAPRTVSGDAAVNAAFTPAAMAIPALLPVPWQIPVVEIHDTAGNTLVTCLEILSPVNKREPGFQAYRGKRQRLIQAGVHLLEIDLLRRGLRAVHHAQVPATPYLTALTRANTGKTEVWPIRLDERLPVIPVPLRSPDADVPLDLQAALTAVYDEAAYDLSIDYQRSPVVPLDASESSRN